MKILIILLVLLKVLIIPVGAIDLTAPPAPSEVEKYIPNESVTFGKDLWYVVKSVISDVAPEITDAFSLCAAIIAVQLLISLVQSFTGMAKKTVTLVGVVALTVMLLGPSKVLINDGIETIQEISEYGKLILPVMTAALAVQGGSTMSAALYAGTVVLDTLLSTAITKVILPVLFAYIALGIASAAVNEPILQNILAFIKWLITWGLKIALYVFTGYMGITGVIGGTADAAAIKATKLAISGMVPVVGNIISDASETILVSTGIVKNATGIYGALVIISMWLIPFIKIGSQYLVLKITEGISSLYADKQTASIVKHFCTAMGFILAILSTISLLFLISLVCFMKGMSP